MPASDQGVSPDRYCLIPRTLIFLTRAGQVLLLKGAYTKRLWAGLYNGIGGHIEQGEDALSAARRELLEETGLPGDSLWLCGTMLVDSGESTGIGIYIFRGEISSAEVVPSPEGTLEWVDQDRLPELPLVEDLPILLPRVLCTQPGMPPFSARSFYDSQERLQVVFSD